MNANQQGKREEAAQEKGRGHLLDTIMAIRSGVGDGLNDEELTSLLRNTLLAEAGFVFLSFSNGCVTLSVPEQDTANWYPEEGWISPEKERIARQLAEKYQLKVYEPVDTITSFRFPPDDTPPIRHHLELTNRWQTVVAAHPQYLKVRLYGNLSDHRYGWEALSPLPLGPDFLHDLAALYSERNTSSNRT